MKKVLGKALHTIRRKMLCWEEECLHLQLGKVGKGCLVQLARARGRISGHSSASRLTRGGL